MVSVIVPALNEAETIGHIVSVALTHPDVDEVIVVDDGSTDGTAAAARAAGARVIVNERNLGKAGAMDVGVRASSGDIILFLDADVIGYTHDKLSRIMDPVIKGKKEMFVGIRTRKTLVLNRVMHFFPIIGGERALTKSLWKSLPDEHKKGFMIETVLNYAAKKTKKGMGSRLIKGIRHVIKEKKYGFWKGLGARISMIREVLHVSIALYIKGAITDAIRYKALLFFVFLAVWVWAAINPLYRDGWLLENLLVVIIVPLIVAGGAYFRLSNLSYTLITAFAILHVIGSHYTYSEVPFGFMLQEWLGASRNMYDRLVHFSFGLFLAYPVRETFMRLAKARGVWGFFFPVELVFAASALFEIVEWGVATVADPAAGLAFLGAQGDIWDAQKDMLLAGVGAIVTMAIVFAVHLRLNKNFRKELKESLRPKKDDHPFGEEALKAIAKDKLES